MLRPRAGIVVGGGVGWKRFRGKMCQLSSNVTVGMGTGAEASDWLMIRRCSGLLCAVPFAVAEAAPLEPLDLDCSVATTALLSLRPVGLRCSKPISSRLCVDLRLGCLWNVTFNTPMYLCTLVSGWGL